MSHTNYISRTAPGFEVTAHTAVCPCAACQNVERKLYCVQFHPEVSHTIEGQTILGNFVLGICGCSGSWKMNSFVDDSIAAIRAKSEAAAFSALFPAALIPQSPRFFF